MPVTTKTRWTAKELLNATFPKPKWIVPDLLPEGLVILAGRPKVGKSWLALQICSAVATGGMVFDRQVEKGDCLYLALEDPGRRLKQRMKDQKWTGKEPVTFETRWQPLDVGGLILLRAELTKNDYRLCVIDTLSRSIQSLDQNDIQAMTSLFGDLQTLAQDTDTTILINDHHNKSVTQMDINTIDAVIGSTAKSGVADCVWGVYRERGKKMYSLRIQGRDTEEQDFPIAFDNQTFAWQVQSTLTQVQRQIFNAIQSNHAKTVMDIAAYLNKAHSQISKEIAELQVQGYIKPIATVGRVTEYAIV